MKRNPRLIAAGVAVVFASSASVWVSPGTETAPRPLVITSVSVIDATGKPPLEGRTVVIRDGRIAVIGEASKTRTPAGASGLDGSGRFLIPGLRNMHVHSVSYDEARKAFPALLAAGITGVRDC